MGARDRRDVVSPVRHSERLDRRGANQDTDDPHEQGQSLESGERVAPLYEPRTRAERDPCPLERQLREICQRPCAISTERRGDRQRVDGHARQQNDIRATGCKTVTVSPRDAKQQRPRSYRNVVGRQGEDVPDTRGGSAVR